ncbi:Uncharacterized protein ChrSV_5050 [Chromobacterium vaccinii]|nr:Uncharacterized protein ChrSW_5044 [Chromobacterium vaccinii]QND92505.1 Uncharacterized protein ChrSV_5050 [Chromobacterium vaccinii]
MDAPHPAAVDNIRLQWPAPARLTSFFRINICQSVESWLFQRWHSILWFAIFKTQYPENSQQSPVIKSKFHHYFD